MLRRNEKLRLLAIARPALSESQLGTFSRCIGGRSAARERARFDRKQLRFAAASAPPASPSIASGGGSSSGNAATPSSLPTTPAQRSTVEQTSLFGQQSPPASEPHAQAPSSAGTATTKSAKKKKAGSKKTRGGEGETHSSELLLSLSARWGAVDVPKSPVFALPPAGVSPVAWRSEHMHGLRSAILHFGCSDGTWALLARSSELFFGIDAHELRALYRKVVFPRIVALDTAEGTRGGAAPFDEKHPTVQAWLASERKAELTVRRKQKGSGGASLQRTFIAHFVTMASGLIGVVPSTLPGNAVLKEYFFDAKHVLRPYPTREEIDALCLTTGIPHSTVKNWFGNTRKVRRGRPAASALVAAPLFPCCPVPDGIRPLRTIAVALSHSPHPYSRSPYPPHPPPPHPPPLRSASGAPGWRAAQ